MSMRGNTQIKIIYKHSFRDQSKEDDYSDLSKNLIFLKFLHYQIQNFGLRNEKHKGRHRKDESGRKELKSTHSGTKSKMNQNIDSEGLEDRKLLDEDSEYSNLLKDNSDSVEFIIPGFLIRITKINKMYPGKQYFSVAVFQRYIRRRRTTRKSKDPPNNEKYHRIGNNIFPSYNIKDRHMIANSFISFIRNNFMVDSKTFLKATMSSRQVKKILAANRKTELELEDANVNALIQSFAQSRQIKNAKNQKKNPFADKGRKYQFIDGPFQLDGSALNTSDIHVRFKPEDGKLDPVQGEDDDSSQNEIINRCNYHYQSEQASSFFEESYTEKIRKKQLSENKANRNVNDINRYEVKELSKYFDYDSSISVAYSQNDNKSDRNIRKVVLSPDALKSDDEKSSKMTSYRDFFDNSINLSSNESSVEDVNYQIMKVVNEEFKNNESVKSGSNKNSSFKTANNDKDGDGSKSGHRSDGTPNTNENENKNDIEIEIDSNEDEEDESQQALKDKDDSNNSN